MKNSLMTDEKGFKKDLKNTYRTKSRPLTLKKGHSMIAHKKDKQ